jgi:serine/threonine protein kinase/tetratricopeptide (TPR) repeat protein
MSDWNPKANDIFLSAADIAEPTERAAFLDERCGTDLDLRRQVDSLLSAREEVGSFLKEPALVLPTDKYDPSVATQPISEGRGTIIGPYKLLQQIGEGGFGVVYMAEQQKPVRRMVALKIIKPGMDTAQVIARFESERQALALMDHPNIAKVLDAGATESGRPYFVMELVKGVPITEFCDKNHMAAGDRLKLFCSVCHAIQHAHHKGVIHRDVKPSNVMVTLHDGVPVVKVIDFGVAKATVQKLTEKTLFTAYGQMIGTPAYMSPEQAEMSGLDIDTRSDVYSLGVLLYELLTGTTPLESKKLRTAGYVEMQRLIREEEPQRPSTRLSSLGEAATLLAGNRGLDVNRLVRLLSGDIDWIVMKALEKDRNRRYATPAMLAEEIERHLAEQPITARPPSTAYKLAKFAKRNRAAVAMVSLVTVVLIVGAAVATWQAVRATRAEMAEREARVAAVNREQEANEQRESADRERRRAEEEKRAAEAVRTFLQDDLLRQANMFNQADSVPVDGKFEIKWDPSINELLDRAAAQLTPERIETKFPNMPFVQAEVLHAAAHGYVGVSQFEKAWPLIDRAVELYSTSRGPDDRITLKARFTQAQANMRSGRRERGEQLFKSLIADLDRVLGPQDRLTFEAETYYGILLLGQGRNMDGIKQFRRLKESGMKFFGPIDQLTVVARGFLASALRMNRQFAEALGEMEAVRATIRDERYRHDHPYVVAGMSELALAYKGLNRPDEAERVLRETLEPWKRANDEFNNNTHPIRTELAWLLLHRKDYAGARQCFADNIKASGTAHERFQSFNGMLHCDVHMERLEDALVNARQALDAALTIRNEQTRAYYSGYAKSKLGWIYYRMNRFDQAEPYLTAGATELIGKMTVMPSHDRGNFETVLKAIVEIHEKTNRPDEAKKWSAMQLAQMESRTRELRAGSTNDLVDWLESVRSLSLGYVKIGQNELALKLFEEAYALLKEKGFPRSQNALNHLGEIMRAAGLAGAKERALSLAMDLDRDYSSRNDTPPAMLGRTKFMVGYTMMTSERSKDGIPYLRESLKNYLLADPKGWSPVKSKHFLGQSLLNDGQFAEAEKVLLEAHQEALERRGSAPEWERHYPEGIAKLLVRVYSATQKPAEAAKWKSKSEPVQQAAAK